MCSTVYTPSIAWWFPAVGLIFVAVGSGLFLLGRGFARWWGVGIGGFAVLWTLTTASSMWARHRDLLRMLTSSQTPVVDGPVEDYHPAPFDGGSESFSVAGVPFSYSDHVITGAFNHTALNGGPIHPGLKVRIRYVVGSPTHGNLIVQLDTCR